MPWVANQIYAHPTAAVLDVLRAQPDLSGLLFLLDDLRGIRNGMEVDAAKQLPAQGLLAVAPVLWGTGYDDPSDREFLDQLNKRRPYDERQHFVPGLGWPVVEPAMDVPSAAARFFPDGRGPSFARQLAVEGGTTVMMYYALTHGGDFEHEVAWVFTPASHTLYLTCDDGPLQQWTDGRSDGEQPGDPLINALRHFGVYLRSGYWAPHETSFHWRPYHIDSGPLG